ncbi:pyrroloquinoline quinone biosynthesis protein PqqE, partial [Amaricoccus sp. HAR-UPW-R2A-40]
AATDPVCVKSPLHGRLEELAAGFSEGAPTELIWRRMREAEPAA